MLDYLINLFLNFFSWLWNHFLLSLLIFWILGKIFGFSIKKTASDKEHRKFWFLLLILVVVIYLLLKEGWLNVF